MLKNPNPIHPGGQLHPLFAAILAVASGGTTHDEERERLIRAARAGEDGGVWAHHVPDYALTLQTINAIVRRSNLDAEAKLSAIRAAIDVAINDAADRFIEDAGTDDAADFIFNTKKRN